MNTKLKPLLALALRNKTMATSYIHSLIPATREMGLDTDLALSRSGIREEELGRDNERISLYRAFQLFQT